MLSSNLPDLVIVQWGPHWQAEVRPQRRSSNVSTWEAVVAVHMLRRFFQDRQLGQACLRSGLSGRDSVPESCAYIFCGNVAPPLHEP